MELDIRLPAGQADLARIEQLLLETDPAAVVDRDRGTGHLRLSTCAGHDEVARILAVAGSPVEAGAITIVPSVCCGGCSG